MADLVYPPVIFTVKTFWKYLGLRFDFRGQEHLPHAGKSGGAVLAINHIGYLDFALAGTAALPMKRYIRFMAKSEIFDHKIAGPLMRGMHHISVDRSAGSGALAQALRALLEDSLANRCTKEDRNNDDCEFCGIAMPLCDEVKGCEEASEATANKANSAKESGE